MYNQLIISQGITKTLKILYLKNCFGIKSSKIFSATLKNIKVFRANDDFFQFIFKISESLMNKFHIKMVIL